MKITSILIVFFFALCFCNCNFKNTRNENQHWIVLPKNSKPYEKIINYFTLSENRKIDIWYNTYLNKCTQFYKIEKPNKDTILNLIKSYWLTSNNQKHEIIKVDYCKNGQYKMYEITMNYSYKIIATNEIRIINKLKLQMICNKKNEVLSIKELSRGM